jgi:hypothetical protein
MYRKYRAINSEMIQKCSERYLTINYEKGNKAMKHIREPIDCGNNFPAIAFLADVSGN